MATMALDSPSVYPESPNDQEDVVYPCKGCGEILEEGKAFELAGNRWHIDCFRCNTCGTLLDSDANLLLLGDGSLICNNCTYSCNACGNKIEDLAILTGDQAFCASCFRCRNCKRKIENLRYARTSQGIFCMSCHESLMARRRKKSKTSKQASATANGAPVEKALPSLPPGAAPMSAFTPEEETPPTEAFPDLAGPRSPREKQAKAKKDLSPIIAPNSMSPLSDAAQKDGPTLPASTYGDAKPPLVSEETEDSEERGLLPMAFDPTSVPSSGTPSISRKQVPRPQEMSPPMRNENRKPRDYFGRLSAKPPVRDAGREDLRPTSSRSGSAEREPERSASQTKTSPHILFQEKGRHRKHGSSGTNTPAILSTAASPQVGISQEKGERPRAQHLETGSYTLGPSDAFKLGEVPQARRAGSRGSSKPGSPAMVSSIDTNRRDARFDAASPASLDSPNSINPFDDPKRKDHITANSTPVLPPPPRHADRPARGDSLAAGAQKTKSQSPEPTTPSTVSTQLPTGRERKDSTSSFPASFTDAHSSISRHESSGQPAEPQSPPSRHSFDAPPPRASSRPTAASKSPANGDFVAPRAPPPPPPPATIDRYSHRHHESISTMQSMDDRSDSLQQSPALRSAGLPKHSMDGSFSMEEEMARILRGERKDSQAGEGAGNSVLRRVSNAVKHGRSFSDRGMHMPGRHTHTHTPPNGTIEISSPFLGTGSPMISTPASQGGLEQLRSHLRRANQRIAELEAEKTGLEEKVNTSAEIKAASVELREKRNTMVVLDTQREMVVAELESMTKHLKRAKDSHQAPDLSALKLDVIRDFADALQKVKDTMSSQIEELMHRRNQLTDEIGTLIQMKDKGIQEYESLSAKNAQLLHMNNQILHGIQDTYKANRAPNGTVASAQPGQNGLGIYQPGGKMESPGSSDLRNLNLVSTDPSMPDVLRETEAEPATLLNAPQVVNIRKGQPKKFNWRKGGEKMAKNVTKGLKGAFVGDKVPPRDGAYGDIGIPYSSTQAAGGGEQNSISSKQSMDARGTAAAGAGFGFFGQKNNGGLKPGVVGNMKNNSSTNLAVAADVTVLFGSDLSARCDYEKRLIPSIVTHCIEEVETRGMDVEGVYRKSGGSGQVKSIQQGFERDGDHDVSDPDLDIHAVTSALKQYFRKLPVPLITYDVYDALLEAAAAATSATANLAAASEKEREQHAALLRRALQELPEHHRDCLEYLIQHLARVMQHQGENLMTPLNLAVVFAPTIMRPLSIEREMSDMLAQRVAVQALLELSEEVFGGEAE